MKEIMMSNPDHTMIFMNCLYIFGMAGDYVLVYLMPG